MTSGRDVYLERVTEEEEEYWRGLTAKHSGGAIDPRQWCLEHEDAENLLQERINMANQRVINDLRRFNEQQRAKDKQVGGDHYKDMGVEPWDVVDTWPLEQRIGAYRHGALKYLMRMGSKDEQLQEIKKCGHYIEKLIEVLESA